MAKELLPDALWAKIEPLLPPAKPRRYRYPRRKPVDRRKALTGILFVFKTGIPWAMLPKEMDCGSGMSDWRTLHAWQEEGVWQKILEVLLAKLREADKIDFSHVSIDSASVRTVPGGPKRAPIPQTAPKRARSTTF